MKKTEFTWFQEKKESLKRMLRKRTAGLLVCSMMTTQFSAGFASPVYAAEDSFEQEYTTLTGKIVCPGGGYRVEEDVKLLLYRNGQPVTDARPEFAPSEDSLEQGVFSDGEIALINDLEQEQEETATGFDASAQVWEYRFYDLPLYDEYEEEYQYTIRCLAYDDGAAESASGSDWNQASLSNASGSDTEETATGSDWNRQTGRKDDLLYWTDAAGTEILGMGGGAYPADGARLVYVPTTDISGAYRFEAGGSEADPEQVTLELSAWAGEHALEDDFYPNGAPEPQLDVSAGTWHVYDVPQYDPLTGAAIRYQVTAVSGLEGYQIRYYNPGQDRVRTLDLESDEDSRFQGVTHGGTIYHEPVRKVRATAELTIKTEYRGQGDDEVSFTYTVEVPEEHSGEADQEEISWMPYGDKITLEKNETEKIKVPVGPVRITQKADDRYYVYTNKDEGAGPRQVITAEAGRENVVTFTNIGKMADQVKKIWDDNNYAGRPSVVAFKKAISLRYAVGDYSKSAEWNELGDNLDREKSIGLTAENIEIVVTEGVGTWMVQLLNLPQQTEEGVAIFYHLTENKLNGYKTEYEYGNGKAIRNTRVTNFTITKKWLDGGNKYQTRFPEGTTKHEAEQKLTEVLTLYRYTEKDSSPEKLDLTTEPEAGKKRAVDAFVLKLGASNTANSLTWNITISDLPVYDSEGEAYTYYVTEDADNRWNIADADDCVQNKNTVKYETAYVNGGLHNEETEKCFAGGTITSTLTSSYTFSMKKVWKAGEVEQKDWPAATFQLMRFSDKDNASYKMAVPVVTKTVTDWEIEKVDSGNSGAYTWSHTFTNQDKEHKLQQFDLEGYRYIYFVRETITGDTKGFSASLPDSEEDKDHSAGNEFDRDKLGLNGSTEPLITNGGTLINSRQVMTTIFFSKEWITGAYQDLDAEVTMKLQRRVEDDEAWEDVEETILSGFRPEELSKSGTFTAPTYDANGFPYEYQVVEAAVAFKVEEGGEYIPLQQTKNESGETVFRTTKDHFTDRQYSYTVEMETSPEENPTSFQFINRLEDTIELEITKYWGESTEDYEEWKKVWNDPNGTNPQQLEFSVLGNGKPCKDEDRNPLKLIMDRKGEEWKHQDTVKKELPRYNERGEEIQYTVKEETETGSTDEIYVYETVATKDRWKDGKFTPQRKATVTNTPPGGASANPTVELIITKEWLDGGDIMHRPESVGFEVCMRDPATGTLVMNDDTGKRKVYRSGTLEANNGWVTELSIETFELGGSGNAKNLIVLETALGEDAKVTYPDGARTYKGQSNRGTNSGEELCSAYDGRGIVQTEHHLYDVYTTDTTDSLEESSDNKRSFTITNVRRGFVSINAKKKWQDTTNETEDDSIKPQTATLSLQIDGDTETDYDEQLLTRGEEAGEDWYKNQFKPLWQNLPKYDDEGYLIDYSIQETQMGDFDVTNGGAEVTYTNKEKHHYTSSITEEPDYGEEHYSGDQYCYTVVNRRQESIPDMTIYKYWFTIQDKKEEIRPDIYLTLYRRLKGSTEKPKEMTQYIQWEASEVEDFDGKLIQYTFQAVPRYDGEGREWEYLFQEGMQSPGSYEGNERYFDFDFTTFGSEDKVDLNQALDSQNKDKFIREKGTIVNMRQEYTSLTLTKKWAAEDSNQKLPDKKDLPAVTAALYRNENPNDTENGKLVEKYKLDSSNNHTKTVTGLPRYSNITGEPYHYWVKEVDEVPGYQVTYNTSGAAITITNTYTPDDSATVTINKTWENHPGKGNLNGVSYDYPETSFTLSRRVYKDAEQTEELSYLSESKVVKEGELQGAVGQWNEMKGELTLQSQDGADTCMVGELSKIAVTGYPYKYEIHEADLPGYEETAVSDADGENTFEAVNRYKLFGDDEDFLTLSGTKTWEDGENQFGTRPDFSKLKLILKRQSKANQMARTEGQTVETVAYAQARWTAAESGNVWNYSFVRTEEDCSEAYRAYFPKYAPDGTEYTYWVEEELAAPYHQMYEQKHPETRSMDLVNGLKETQLTAVKVWEDEENRYDARPEKLTFAVQRKPHEAAASAWEDYETEGQPVTITVKAEEDWTASISLPLYGPGTDGTGSWYQYRAVEKTPVPRYIHQETEDIHSTAQTPEGDQVSTITNRFDLRDLKVTKVWEDKENRYHTRPETITVTLQRRGAGEEGWQNMGEERTLSQVNGWTGKFTDLVAFDEENRPYQYRAVETRIGNEEMKLTGASQDNVTGLGGGYAMRLESQEASETEETGYATVLVNRLETGVLEIGKTMKNKANGQDFQFQVDLTLDGRAYRYQGEYLVAGMEETVDAAVLHTTGADGILTLDGEQKLWILDLPDGASYQITELEKRGYRLESAEGAQGVIEAGETAKALFTNRRIYSGGSGGSGGSTRPTGVGKEEMTGPGVPRIGEGRPGTEEGLQQLSENPVYPVDPETGKPVITGGSYERRTDLPPEYVFEALKPLGGGLFLNPMTNQVIYIAEEDEFLGRLVRTGTKKIPILELLFALSAGGILAAGGKKRRKREE